MVFSAMTVKPNRTADDEQDAADRLHVQLTGNVAWRLGFVPRICFDHAYLSQYCVMDIPAFIRLPCVALCFAEASIVLAAYPERPIRLVVPFAPGGNIDITARTIAPGMSEQLGQQVIVENRGGAGGRVGTEAVAKAAPDGYTWLLGSSGSLTVNPVFASKATYDPLRDFVPTSLISIVPLALIVHPSLPARTTREFIALAKSKPGAVLMASAGTGSNTHLTGELFQVTTGVKLVHVPYKGSGQAITDLIGGHAHCIFDQVSASGPHVITGKLRAIAVASSKRSTLLPDVPTMGESGLKGFESSTYTGVFLPSATPKDIVSRVYGALVKVLDQPATREAFNRLGAEVIKAAPEEVTRRMTSDIARWRKVQSQTGIRID
jgi:tripartite-type tricarboxylate transporter receptor subunit TctC